MEIKNRDKLLLDMAYGLDEFVRSAAKRGGRADISFVDVTLYEGPDDVFTSNFATAFRFLMDDTYWDETSNWAMADRAEVCEI